MWNAALRAEDSQVVEPPEVQRWHFFRGLRASKLMPPEDVDRLERDSQGSALEEIEQALLDQGVLTSYQVRRIHEGTPTGLVLAQYRVLDELGSGGFGQVYKAAHAVMNRVVALKLMTPDRCRNRLFRDVFYREVAAVTRLNHPNVVLTFDANEVDGVLFLAMEFVEGPTLHTFVTDHGPPDVSVAASIMLQLADGLRHAHEAGLVHRDLKPANVLVQGSEPETAQVKIIDFGLARLHARGGEVPGTLLADAGALVGTPAFMAPEQALNYHDADARSDLYSLGCTFYYLFTGRLPFEASSCRAVLALHATRPPRPLSDLRPDVPVGLTTVVHRLMAKNPTDRYQTAAELCDVLTALVPSLGVSLGGGCEAPPPAREEFTPLAWAESAPAPTVAVFERPNETCVVDADARQLWLQWCVVVETLAQGRTPEQSAARYEKLYGALVRTLKAAGRPGSGLDQLRVVVEPWVTLRALQSLDPAAVTELWQTCQVLDATFGPRPVPSRYDRSVYWWVAACVLAVVPVAVLLAWPYLLGVFKGAVRL